MDPRIRADTQSSDHRSVISAPQLWEDKVIKKEDVEIEEEKALLEFANDGFSAFQNDNQKGTSTSEESFPASSVVDGLSSVPATLIRMEDRTDDGRILSEIKSIRAMIAGKSKESSVNNPPILAPILPIKSKSTPASQIGAPTSATSGLRRAASFPEGNIYTAPQVPIMEVISDHYSFNDVPDSKHVATKGSVSDLLENTKSSQDQLELVAQPEANPDEDLLETVARPLENPEEDIWLAQTSNSRAARRLVRKRKKEASGDEDVVNSTINEFPAVGINMSRSTTSSSGFASG